MQNYEITLNGKTIWNQTTTEQAAYSTLERLSNLLAKLGLTGVLELTCPA